MTRFDKLAKSYVAMVSLACSMRCLQHLFRTEPSDWLPKGRYGSKSVNHERLLSAKAAFEDGNFRPKVALRGGQ